MPSILTHYIFFNEYINDDSSIGNVGTQGPDPFYFYFCGFRKLKNTKEICEIGTFLHQINPISTFIYFYEYINKFDESDKIILNNYLKGLIAHYCLDSVVHPYVFYKSGFSLTDSEDEIHKYFLDHVNLETYIDVLIKDYYHYNITPSKTLKVHKKDLQLVSEMYKNYLVNYCNFYYVDDKTFFTATKRMSLAYKFIYSHFGMRKKFYNKFLKNSSINAFSNPSLKYCKKKDYLNLSHQEYHDVTNNSLIGNFSIIDLFNEAKKKYENIINILFSIVSIEQKITLLKDLIDDLNHDGNKVGAKKLYFNSFF